ncbi:MAG: class I SAM-dependent methyltransferase [Desulfofustis sp.]|jgi:ubiquinone/menaquinone biosynthesis C-methylase UbiE
MQADSNKGRELFDDWPRRYDRWFETETGRLVKHYEAELLHTMLDPRPGDYLLDVGCGTGIFTASILAHRAAVVGLDLSLPMISAAAKRFRAQSFSPMVGNMLALPFASGSFDKVFSMTAIEFVANGQAAVAELERVTKNGGTIVLTTLNRLSPWAERRLKKAEEGHELFKSMIFRSPAEIRRMVPEGAAVKTAIHFQKKEDPVQAQRIEAEAQSMGLETGAFLAVSWTKKL